MENSTPGAFIADRMLGRMARYLRLMGYDVIYPRPCPDAQLLAMARSQGRILLTRDRGMAARESSLKGSPQVIEINSCHVMDQIKQLVDQGWIKGTEHPRCSYCNHYLQQVSPGDIRHLVPPFVLSVQHAFLYCPSCNIVLWKGSHWVHFQDSISRVLRESPRS